MFDTIYTTFENPDLLELAMEMQKTIPSYFYHVPASSTGKYHPEYALGDGGLLRHTVALLRFMNHLFEVSGDIFTSREKDLLRIAGMMHDSRKSGTQEEFEASKYTKFDHPLLAAAVVRSFKGKSYNDDEVELIAHAIESHMGKWNKDARTGITLPVPGDKYQYMLSWCDYLASRKDILMSFEGWDGFVPATSEVPFMPTNDQPKKEEKPALPENPADYVMPFGKYKGKTLGEINEIAPDYIRWAKEKMEAEPAASMIRKLK